MTKDRHRRHSVVGLALLSKKKCDRHRYEAEHRDNTDEQSDHARALAAQLGLFTTGASDYHGDGKPNRLGENTTDPEVLAEIERQATSGVEVVRS